MDKLLVSALLTMLLFMCAKSEGRELMPLFETVAYEYNLDAEMVKAVCWIESNHKADAINMDDPNGGAHGLCQLAIPTARWIGKNKELNAKSLLNPELNVTLASKYLRYQMNRYKNNERYAIAAYNAGSLIRNKKGEIVNSDYVAKVFHAWIKKPWKKSQKK